MIHDFEPAYIRLYASGELQRRIERTVRILASCRLCPRECGVDRTRGERGLCNAPGDAVISSAGPHYGEEPPLVGTGGSGTIFFTHCNLKCVFCQNADISQMGHGDRVSAPDLAEKMLRLQEMGCHNVNLVTPTPYVPQILEALHVAASEGLRLPLVYNCGGYESLETIRLLDGVVDIYMPDCKYGDQKQSALYSRADDYVEKCLASLREMHRQVGDLVTDERGVARRGLLIRHLVMPEDVAGSDTVLTFIAERLSRDSYVNIMDQYYPSYMAHQFPVLTRRITRDEYDEAIGIARRAGLHRGF